MARLVFFGNERLVSGLKSTDTPVLRALITAGHSIAAVVSHHSDGISRDNRPLEVAEIAKEHGIPVLLPAKPSDIIEDLRNFKAEAAILVAYGRIIPQSVIDVFPQGIINIHPSLLPQYRGPTPIESAIINGDSRTGISIMQLTAGMDEGPVYVQESVNLDGTETKFDLYQTLADRSASLLLAHLPAIIDGSLQPVAQDSSQATYCQLLTKADSVLPVQHLTAAQAERRVRAHLHFPKTKITLGGHSVIITEAHVSPNGQTLLDVPCQDGMFLSIDQLIAPSGKRMSAEAFLRGYAAA